MLAQRPTVLSIAGDVMLVIGANGLVAIVIMHLGMIFRIRILASGASVSDNAPIGAVRLSGHCTFIVMAQGGNHSTAGSMIATSAISASFLTIFGAGSGSLAIRNHIMAQGGSLISNIAVATRAGVGGIAALGTGGLGYRCLIIMRMLASIETNIIIRGVGELHRTIRAIRISIPFYP
jgi:hypothetical protein